MRELIGAEISDAGDGTGWIEYQGNPAYGWVAELAMRNLSSSLQYPLLAGQVLVEALDGDYVWLFRDRLFAVPMSTGNEYGEGTLDYQSQLVEAFVDELERGARAANRRPSSVSQALAERIPDDVREAVWARDGGSCARCGSRESIEFSFMIAPEAGGSNGAGNVELLCMRCAEGRGSGS